PRESPCRRVLQYHAVRSLTLHQPPPGVVTGPRMARAGNASHGPFRQDPPCTRPVPGDLCGRTGHSPPCPRGRYDHVRWLPDHHRCHPLPARLCRRGRRGHARQLLPVYAEPPFRAPLFRPLWPYIGLHADRLERAEAAFKRWGPWAIILGRHVPGFRIVLSAFAGAFEFPRRLFVICVLISSSIWAAIFLELGRALGRNSRYLFRVFPAHLVPLGILLLALLWVLGLGCDHAGRHRREARRRARASASHHSEATRGLPSKAEGRTAKM